ncbi:MAG: hypothetical protein ABIP71_03595 [Verrucomicrobiota bacterium]
MKKFLCLFGLSTCAVLVGCVTPSRVAQMEGNGKKMVFAAPYDEVWRAAVDAAQAGELDVRTADKTRGYIGATRGLQMHTMGENVGVWITQVSPHETQVEVVSRQAGLPVAWFKNWENQILNGVAANLTRETNYRGRMEEPAGIDRYPDQRRYGVPPPPVEPPVNDERRP